MNDRQSRGISALNAPERRRSWLLPVAIPVGMIVGGALQSLGRVFMPPGAVKEFLTSGFTWQSSGVHTWPILIGHLSFGPAATDVSLLALGGVFLTVWLLRLMFR